MSPNDNPHFSTSRVCNTIKQLETHVVRCVGCCRMVYGMAFRENMILYESERAA